MAELHWNSEGIVWNHNPTFDDSPGSFNTGPLKQKTKKVQIKTRVQFLVALKTTPGIRMAVQKSV